MNLQTAKCERVVEFLLFSYKRLCTAVFGILDTRQIKFLPTVREGNVITGVCLSTGGLPSGERPLPGGRPHWTEPPEGDPLGQRPPPKEHGTRQEVTSYTP